MLQLVDINNLLIRTKFGIRYPSIRSAEDHWLVTQLLFFRADEAAILPYPVYCHYSLRGQTTTNNEKIGAHRRVREELASASRSMPVWLRHVWLAPFIPHAFLHPEKSMVTKAETAALRKRGIGVNTWTVNDPADILRVTEAGVNAIMGDSPATIRTTLGI